MIKTFPCIVDILKVLKNRQVKLSLVTGKESSRTIEILKKFDLDKYFDLLVCSDMVTSPKPNPESIFKSINYFSISNSECLMVGDSISDIVSAQRADVKTIAVTWGVGNYKLFEEIGADYIIHNPEDLLGIILN